MAQRVNLSQVGLPIRKKTFVAKTEAEVLEGGPYQGLIDSYYLFNRVLSLTEITNLYNQGI